MSEDEDAVRYRLGEAISQALPDAYVTRWVSLVEVIDPDGERALWCLTPDEMRAWDTLGLLTFAVQMEQAGAVDRDD